MSIDSAIFIACDVLKCLVAPIKCGFGYVMSPESYANNLREEVKKLEHEVERLHHAMEVARNNLHNVYSRATELQASSENALKEAQDLLGDFEKATKTCCYGTLPEPSCRYQFSKKAKHKTENIKRLAGNCRELHKISYSRPPPGNAAEPTSARREGKDVIRSTTATASASSTSTSIKLRDDGIFESRASVIQEILDALADNRYSVVGVYGMGGVGKSTLLADAKERIREKNLFDWVAKGDVSENPDIKRIQGEIADALGLSDIKDKESVSGRAELLRRRLEREEKEKNKVLIILDNLWKGLDLNSVGIPCGHDNKVIGCKLLLTSRNRDVLQRDMGCDRDFLLDGLKEEEAKELFERIVGDKFPVDEFKPLVDEALHKCAGLPFLIVNMSKRFKHADSSEWKYVLKQIKLSKNEGLGKMINNMLQLSYDHLNDAEKSLLALCVAYGTTMPSLENLVMYGVGWGLFQEDSTIEEARNSLKSQIRALQASSLLLGDGDAYDFKIHDLVREFVASVASRDHPLLVLKDEDKSIAELPKYKLKSCRAICFPYVDMKEVPQELDCPELQIFLLFTNNGSLKVPYSLFYSMRKLMVLRVTGIRLTCSPSPFQFLKNLRTLCLKFCSLDDIAILGELKGLQILSLVNSNIQQLPKEIGQLVELRLLDLSHCSKLQRIEPGVLQNLIKLEELYMKNSFNQWNVMEQTPPTSANMIELNHMKNLNTLHVSILNSSVLPGDLDVEKLTKYNIQMGDKWKEETSYTLKLKWDPLSNIFQKGCIQSILGKTNNLFLDSLNGMEQSICTLSEKGFPELKHVCVQNSPSIHYILQSPSRTNFKMLESLFLLNLTNLEKICTKNIPSKSFNALKVLRVEHCHKIEVLFPLSSVRELPQLEEIKIVDCKLMRGILEANDSGKFEWRNLHSLELRYLPKLNDFFTARSSPSSSTSDNPIDTQIAYFNGQQVALQSLETLEIIGLDNLGFMFFRSMFKFVRSLTIYKCNNLRHAFALSVARCLANLKWMDISECGQMKGVIAEEEGQGCTVENITFLKLKQLKLKCLPNLTSFLSGNNHTLECPILDELDIIHCPKMRSLTGQSLMEIDHGTPSLFSPQVQFPQLGSMVFSHMDNLSKIWTNIPKETLTFDSLWKVKVQNCKSLENLFPHWVATSLTQLKKLKVESCGIEEIVASEDDTPHSNASQILFPKLTSLVLHDMPRLQSFGPNLPSLNWQFLEKLRVTHCDKLNMLSFAASMNSWAQRDDQQDLSNQEAPSSFERDFPMLDRLSLVDKNIQMMQDGKFLEDILGKLKALTLACFHDKKVVFPPRFVLERLQNLQSLEIFCNSFEDIFPDEGLIDEGKHLVLENLKELKLNKLHNLKSVWREDFLVGKTLQSIETLKVWDCPCLTTIFPAVTSFQNLTELVVKNCSGLVHIVTASTVTNLVHLTWMTIIGCEIMKEIVANDGNEEEKVISLGKLESLTLQHLPSLECFSSIPSCIFNLPSLFEIKVEDCPKMKTFSKGILSTPWLQLVTLFKYKWAWTWEGRDLNTTIQKLSA